LGREVDEPLGFFVGVFAEDFAGALRVWPDRGEEFAVPRPDPEDAEDFVELVREAIPSNLSLKRG
jgi:hypothetical protein